MPRNGLMTEAELQSSIVRALRINGWKVDFTWKSLHSPKGRPDLVAERAGCWIVTELKDGKLMKNGSHVSQPTPEQVDWLIRYSNLGLRLGDGRMGVYLWRPDDLEDAYRVILGQTGLDSLAWLSASWTTKPVPVLKSDPLLTEGPLGRAGYPGPVTPEAIRALMPE